MQQWPIQRIRIFLIVGGLLVFFLAYFSINTDTGSDPRLTLVVSQALLETGEPFLDPYASDILLGQPFDSYVADGDILELNGRYANYFPLGPSLISVPFVLIANSLGYDMRTADNYELQRILSAATVLLVFLLAYALARTYLDNWPSLVLAFVAVLGSSLVSTLGTALWSHNYAVLFTGAALLIIAREAIGKSSSYSPVLVGLLLFLSFINRPSTVAFILPALAYILWRQRRVFFIAALTSAVLLGGYLTWNAMQTGVWLPSYFSTARLQVVRAPLWIGVAGNLISPSRGLLIFSPFLLPVLAGYVIYWRSLLRQPIVWLCLVWFGLQLVIITRAASWWGGWSFGPRLLTDIWPGLIVLAAILWAYLLESSTTKTQHAFAYTFLALGAIAIILNVVQGLYSQPTSRWNDYIDPAPSPSDDSQFGDLFNWRYAQPLASNGMLCAMERAAVLAYPEEELPISPSSLGQPFLASGGLTGWDLSPVSSYAYPQTTTAAPKVDIPHPVAGQSFLPLIGVPAYSPFYLGWSAPTSFPENQVSRWSQCPEAEIWLNLAPGSDAESILLTVTGLTNSAQEVTIAINGQQAGAMQWSGQLETQTITFPTSMLSDEGLTHLMFSFPAAHFPNLRDQRPLGLALVELTLSQGSAGDVIPAAPSEKPASYPP